MKLNVSSLYGFLEGLGRVFHSTPIFGEEALYLSGGVQS